MYVSLHKSIANILAYSSFDIPFHHPTLHKK